MEARKKIYIPLYSDAAVKTEAFSILKEKVDRGEKIAIKDFDVYRHDLEGKTFEDLIEDSNRPLGHGFVLYNLLTK